MPVCTVRGVNLHYLSSGNEARKDKAMVFVHGATGNARRWYRQLDDNGQDLFSVALDLPGHGLSEGIPCEQVFLYREWVKEFLDAMGLEKVVIAGHSMGGGIAMEMALAYPQRVKGLVLVGTGAKINIDPTRIEAVRQGEYNPEWARGGFSSSAPTELVDIFVEESRQTDFKPFYPDFLACNHINFESAQLEKINVPTLVICGTEDIPTPPDYSRFLAAHIKGARLLVVEPAAHNVMIERPEIVNKAIGELLAGL